MLQNRNSMAGGATAQAGNLQASGTSTDSSSTSRVINKDLDRDAFLQLLVMQMQNQDPMEPMDNSQMIAQLAQLTSLEQMEKLNTSFDTLSGNVDQLNFLNASSMIGKYVTGVDSSGTEMSGTVDGVQMQDSVVQLVVGGKPMSMAGVAEIRTQAPTTTASK
jgi:flagellar basal-body rod modification protein FlgD